MRVEIQDRSSPTNVRINDPFRRSRAFKYLLRECAEKYGTNLAEMMGRSTLGNIARARWEFGYRAYVELDAPISIIKSLLNKHHETVRYGIAKHCKIHGLMYPPGFGGDFWINRVDHQRQRRAQSALGKHVHSECRAPVLSKCDAMASA